MYLSKNQLKSGSTKPGVVGKAPQTGGPGKTQRGPPASEEVVWSSGAQEAACGQLPGLRSLHLEVLTGGGVGLHG